MERITNGGVMGASRQWQGLTPAQVTACNGIGTSMAEHAAAMLNGPPADPVLFLMDHQRAARGTGAIVQWLGGLHAGIVWHRPPSLFAGDLWLGQVAVKAVVGLEHRHNLMVDQGGILDTIMYAFVTEQDAPNFCLWGWCKGHELAQIPPAKVNGRNVHMMRKDHRDFRDLRELKHLGTQSIARMRECGKLPG